MHFSEVCQRPHYAAVAGPFWVRHNGKEIEADLIKPLNGDGWFVYEDTGIRIRKATAAEIDSVRKWRTY